MPTFVELPDKTELEFPDGMDEISMRREIVKAFPQFAQETPSESVAVSAPGEAMAAGTPRAASLIPEAFPAQTEQLKEMKAAKTPELTGVEVESMLMTPQITIPNVIPSKIPNPIPASFPNARAAFESANAIPNFLLPIERGLFTTAKGIPEFITAPGAPLITMAQQIPGVREAVDAAMGAGMVKTAALLAGEASVTGDKEQMAQAVSSGLLGSTMLAAPHVAPILANELAARNAGVPDLAKVDLVDKEGLSLVSAERLPRSTEAVIAANERPVALPIKEINPAQQSEIRQSQTGPKFERKSLDQINNEDLARRRTREALAYEKWKEAEATGKGEDKARDEALDARASRLWMEQWIEENKPAPAALEQAPQVEAPAAETVSLAPQASEVAASESLPAISQPTPPSESGQVGIAATGKPEAAVKRGPIQRPWDIIDEIQSSVGKIRSKKYARAGSEGYYGDAYKEAQSGAGRDLFGEVGQSPDEALDTLRRSGFLGENATVDDLWAAVQGAKAQRRAIFRGETPEIQADKFQSALQKQGAKKGSHFVSVGDLSVGDKFRIGGEELEVVSINPDTGEVTVKDGRKFGHQTIPDGADLPVEKGSVQSQSKVATFTKEDFALNAPETVEQQKARLAREEEVAKAKADREKLEEQAAKPLIGSRGDIGQGDLLGGGDLLSGPIPKIVGMGGATPEEFTAPGTIVSNMFAAIDRDRAEMGKPPMEPGTPRTWSQDQAIAMNRLNHDPTWIPDLIKEVLDKPRPLLSWEQAGMVMQKAFWKAEANNALKRLARAAEDGLQDDVARAKVDAARFEDNLQQMEDAVGRGGTGSEAGRSLQAQKMGLTDDLSLVEMRLQKRADVGGRRLTESESKEVEARFNEIKAANEALTNQVAESARLRAEAETRATLAEIGRQAAESKVPAPHIQRLIEKVGQTIHDRANAARERLKGKLFTLSPEVLKDLAEVGADNIWTIGEDFTRWSVKMVEDIGERVKPHLQAIWDASKKLVEDTWTEKTGKKTPKVAKQVELAKQTVKKGDALQQKIGKLTARIQDKFDKGKQNEITPSVQRLARAFVESGVRGREELIDAVHGVLEQILPDFWTRRMTMDAISGYGDYKVLSKDEVSLALRDLKGQMQQVAKLEDMASRQAPLRTGLERREPTPSETKLIKLVNEAKRKGGYETTDPAKQLRTALDEMKKKTQTMIDEYERRIREEDYSVRRLEPVKPDAALLTKQAELKRARKRWEEARRADQMANRAGWQKALDRFVRWERAFKLSSPIVFGKLSAAAVTRFVETAASETAGAGLGLLPGIRAVARQAPREGGINVKAMAKGLTEAMTKGMRDAWETAKTGASNLDVVYGEKLIDRDWANVFGQLHGMLKAPVKRAEFTLSLEKRIEHALKNGIDVNDPLVMTRLATEALSDGYRSIFMQRGFFSDWFNTAVRVAEASKKHPVTGEITARTLRFLLPVVRVPMNIVAETGTGIYGFPVASLRTMMNITKGTLGKLDPVVADSIMRQFKKGSIGLGLMAIGYFTPQMVGGYDWREKRAIGAVKTGGFQVAGQDIPRWMTHAPWFELMQFGATIRHVQEQHVKGVDKGIGEGLWAAGLGLIEETPFIGQMIRVDKLFESEPERTYYLGELAKGTLVPQAINKIAQITDRRFGQEVKRKPTTVLEHVESGIPGLRQNVPEAKAR